MISNVTAPDGLCPFFRNDRRIAVSIRSSLFAIAFGIAALAPAHADGLLPIEGKSIDLGGISGIAYYTVERDGFHFADVLSAD